MKRRFSRFSSNRHMSDPHQLIAGAGFLAHQRISILVRQRRSIRKSIRAEKRLDCVWEHLDENAPTGRGVVHFLKAGSLVGGYIPSEAKFIPVYQIYTAHTISRFLGHLAKVEPNAHLRFLYHELAQIFTRYKSQATSSSPSCGLLS